MSKVTNNDNKRNRINVTNKLFFFFRNNRAITPSPKGIAAALLAPAKARPARQQYVRIVKIIPITIVGTEEPNNRLMGAKERSRILEAT
jgi:hypothetical protein